MFLGENKEASGKWENFKGLSLGKSELVGFWMRKAAISQDEETLCYFALLQSKQKILFNKTNTRLASFLNCQVNGNIHFLILNLNFYF